MFTARVVEFSKRRVVVFSKRQIKQYSNSQYIHLQPKSKWDMET
jgi:hypothetical protein